MKRATTEKPSKILECKYCGRQIHARAMPSHVAHKHPAHYRTQRTPTALEDRATPRREAHVTTRAPSGAGKRPKAGREKTFTIAELIEKTLPVRSEPAESNKGGRVEMRCQRGCRRPLWHIPNTTSWMCLECSAVYSRKGTA
ncbi:hypothetical protein ES708_34175 [subsurface metagenome]